MCVNAAEQTTTYTSCVHAHHNVKVVINYASALLSKTCLFHFSLADMSISYCIRKLIIMERCRWHLCVAVHDPPSIEPRVMAFAPEPGQPGHAVDVSRVVVARVPEHDALAFHAIVYRELEARVMHTLVGLEPVRNQG